MEKANYENLDLVSGGKKPVQLVNGKWIVVRDNPRIFNSKEDADRHLSELVNEKKFKKQAR